MKIFQFLGVIGFLFVSPVLSFTWQLSHILGAERILQFSEQFMYGSYDGPIYLPQGPATISSDLIFTSLALENYSSHVAYAVYAVENAYAQNSVLLGMCGDALDPALSTNTWAKSISITRLPLVYSGVTHRSAFSDDILADDNMNSHYMYSSKLSAEYLVPQEGWYVVAVEYCLPESQRASSGVFDEGVYELRVDGEITFGNPYGYLPAFLVGILPYQAFLVLSCFGLLGFYVVAILRHWKSAGNVTNLHYSVLSVILLMFVESIVWFITYIFLNETGIPYCCPFPPLVAGAMMMQVFRQAFSRALLLAVSLGYGIGKVSLHLLKDWAVIITMTILYFIVAAYAQLIEIESMNSLEESQQTMFDVIVNAVAVAVDAVFLTLIIIALMSTINELKAAKQTYKLEIYSNLAKVLGGVLTLFVGLSVLLMLNNSGRIALPWQLQWIPLVLWPTCSFVVVVVVAFMTLPSERGFLLAYSSQIPSFDPDGNLEDFNDSLDDEFLDADHNDLKYDDMTPIRLNKPVSNPMNKKADFGKNINVTSQYDKLNDEEKEFEMVMQGQGVEDDDEYNTL